MLMGYNVREYAYFEVEHYVAAIRDCSSSANNMLGRGQGLY